jgi:peptide/nickel transport system permease protein
VVVAVAGLAVALAVGGALLPGQGDAALRIVAAPWTPPGPGLPLGTDGLGRDVLARTLAGGRSVTLTALASAVAATAVGTAAGLWSGWGGGRAARAADALADLTLAVPLLLVALLAAGGLPGPAAVAVATVVGGAPLTMRVVADATRGARRAGYVEAALGRGERASAVLLREVLPAHAGLLGADLALRFVVALQLAAALAVLGFGAAPPAPDWAGMLRENLPGAGLNAAAVLAPAAALTALAASVAGLAHVLSEQDRA